MAGNQVTLPTIGGDQTFDAGVGFDHNRHTPQGAAFKADMLGGSVFRGGCTERAGGIHSLYGSIDAIVFSDAC